MYEKHQINIFSYIQVSVYVFRTQKHYFLKDFFDSILSAEKHLFSVCYIFLKFYVDILI